MKTLTRALLVALVATVALPTAAQQPEPTAQERARTIFIEALRLAQAGELDGAIARAQEAAALDDANADGMNMLGQLLQQKGDMAGAEQAFLRAMTGDPSWAEPFFNLGALYVRRSMFAAALTPLTQATELAPEDARAHALRAMALANRNRPADAARAYDRAFALDPGNAALALDVALARIAAGDRRAALVAARVAAAGLPDEPRAAVVLAQLLADSDREDDLVQAPAAFRAALRLTPDDYRLWAALASTYHDLALYDDAETAHRQAMEHGLEGSTAWFNLGQIMRRQERFAESIEAYDRVLELDPDAGQALYYRGEAHFNGNNHDQALIDLEAAMALMPGDPNPILAAVNVLLIRGELEKADQYLAQALATGQAETMVKLSTARLRLRQERNEDVVALTREVTAAAPNVIEAQYLRGQALVRLGRTDEGRAELAEYQQRLAEQREEINEELRIGVMGRGLVYLIRGRVFLAEQRYEDALRQFEAAAELAPDNSDTWGYILRIHEATGNTAGAAAARARLGELGVS